MSHRQRFSSSHGFNFSDWKQPKNEQSSMIHCISTEEIDYYNGSPDQVEHVNNNCLVLSVKKQRYSKSPYKNSSKVKKYANQKPKTMMSASNGFELLKNTQKSLVNELKSSICKKNSQRLVMQNVSNI